jgi:hypothetical protein
MSLLSKVSSFPSVLRDQGLYGTGKIMSHRAVSGVLGKTGFFQDPPVFEDDWDILIVLDACRHDVICEMASEYEYLPKEIPYRYSVGSASDTWMERTFTSKYRNELLETAYITGNPNTESSLQHENLLLLDEVWKTEFDNELGTTPARPITDRAISTHRSLNPERMILHYMQPHFPSIPDPLGFGIRKGATDPDKHTWIWEDGKPSGISLTQIWKSYRENLRYVLDELTLLLKNVDSDRVIITADHGNAYGEWGLWGHPHYVIPVLRKVPWIKTSATDKQTKEPEVESTQKESQTVEDQLRALGYR